MTSPRADDGLRIGDARRALAQRFRAAGIETPDLDARILIGEACALDLTGLALHAERLLTPEEAHTIEAFAQRRLGGEPVARILGRKEFWGLSFTLTPDALVPRPDTETIVEAALASFDGAAPARLADIGTGSGAILLALLSEWPQARGIGTDISEGALACARANAAALGLEARASFLACDLADGLSGPFDLIVSNPPYIPAGDIDWLAIEVRAHDPRLALDGGPDGLAPYRSIAEAASRLLRPGGWLIVETGFDQTGAVAGLFSAAGLDVDRVPLRDLAGRPRGVRAQAKVLKQGPET